MGAQHSFDGNPPEINQINSVRPVCSSTSAFDSNLKVWKFYHPGNNGEEVSVAGVADLTQEFDPMATYLLLHLTAPQSSLPAAPGPVGGAHLALLSLATAAIQQASPRGVRLPFAQAAARPDGGMGFALYLWNGRAATRLVEARAVVRALELERLLLSSRTLAKVLFVSGDPRPITECASHGDTRGFRPVAPATPCHLLARLCPSTSPYALRETLGSLLGLAQPSPSEPSGAQRPEDDVSSSSSSPSPSESSASSAASLSAAREAPAAPVASKLPVPIPSLSLKGLSGVGEPTAPASAAVPPLRLHLANKPEPAGRTGSPAPLHSQGRGTPPPARPPQRPKTHDPPARPPGGPSTRPGAGPSTALHIAKLSPSLPARDPDPADQNPSLDKARKLQKYRPIPSRIEPFLFVGSDQPAEDEKWLFEAGITDIINVASSVCTNKFVHLLNYWSFPLADSPNAAEDIFSVFPEVLHIIETTRAAGGKAYVHCGQGVSRSCTVVLAYLMWRKNLSFNQAIADLKELRPICSPNTGFISTLLEWQKQLAHPRQVLLWRLSPFSSSDSVPFVVRLEARVALTDDGPGKASGFFREHHRVLDRRTAYLLTGEGRLFLWRGVECPAAWIPEMERLAGYVVTYCLGASGRPGPAPAWENIRQGEESEESEKFWVLCGLLGLPCMAVEAIPEYDPLYAAEAMSRHTEALEAYRGLMSKHQPGVRTTAGEKRKRKDAAPSPRIPARKSPRDH